MAQCLVQGVGMSVGCLGSDGLGMGPLQAVSSCHCPRVTSPQAEMHCCCCCDYCCCCWCYCWCYCWWCHLPEEERVTQARNEYLKVRQGQGQGWSGGECSGAWEGGGGGGMNGTHTAIECPPPYLSGGRACVLPDGGAAAGVAV